MGAKRRTVLVTGASSGIGRATATLLAAEGFHVLAGVRCALSHERLAEASTEHLTPIRLDVTCPDHVARVVDQVHETGVEGLYGLVNNAGIGPPSAVELSDLDEFRHILEVNTIAPLRLIQACLPLLRRGGGRVINMSSMNGALALPMVGAYSASKFALEALSDTLRLELRPWGIPVSVIRPGQVRTAIFAKARAALDERTRKIPAELAEGYQKLYARAGHFNERGATSSTKPETVARVVLKILRAKRPKSRYIVGLDTFGLHLAQALIPSRLFDRILARASGAEAAIGHGRRPPTAVNGKQADAPVAH